MSNKSQTDLSGLLNSIEGLTGLFENLLEAELTLNSSAATQAAAAATSASAAASTAASVTSMAATIATETGQVITDAAAVASNTTTASSAATNASVAATAAQTAATAAQAAATAATNAQSQLNTLYEFTTSGGTVTLTAAQAAAGIIWVQGLLAGNLTIVMPATVHPFILDNATTGTYSVTIQMTGGAANCIIGQGTASQLYCDGATGVYSVSSVSGLQFTGVKPVGSATNVLTNQYQGAYTPMSNATGSTYQTILPQGATMSIGGAVFLDAISGKWSILTNGTDTADFGASYAMNVGDKAMFTWNGSSWRTTLYSNQASPTFKTSLTVPVAFITRGVFGNVTDDGTTAVQATTGRFTTSLTVPTMTVGDNSFNAASTAFVYAVVNNLIGGAPGNLDTLKELADAINDDTSYAATVTNLIAAKASLSGASFTGPVSAPSVVATGGYISAYGWGSNNQNGMLYLSQNGANYLLWDGTNYNMPNGGLKVNGSAVWTATTLNPANYAALANAATFGGAVTGTAQVGALKATSTGTNQTSIQLLQPGAATDQKTWELIFQANGAFKVRAVNDAYTNEYDAIVLNRNTGYTIGSMQLMSNGGRILAGSGVVDDTFTPLQLANGLTIQRISGGGQQLMIGASLTNFVSGSAQTNNVVNSYSAAGNAKLLVLNATTDTSDTPSTAGTVGVSIQIYSKEVSRWAPTGSLLINTSVDDQVSKLQMNGSMSIQGAGNGITFPDGTTQTTAYIATAPTVISYTPGAGVKTFACQNYGLNLVQVFENGSFLTTAEYTATTGNSITLNNAADGKTQYTVVAGALFNQSNVIQPQVSVQTIAQGATGITLPVSTSVGYLWIFQNSAWLIPGVDFTFNGGTSVTLTTAATQGTDTFTLVMLQPISFSGSATITALQAASYTFAADTGVVNAYAVNYIPAVVTPTNGMQLSFFASHTNTGAVTLVCNGGTTYPVYGNGHSQLTGGEIVLGGFVEVAFSAALGAWILLECTGGAQQMAGNLNFIGSGLRITGDMSNASYSNQLAFQSSTVNGATNLNVLPNGTGASTQLIAWQKSDPTNSPYMLMNITATAANLAVGALGSGTILPLAFTVGGAERMRFLTNGNAVFAGTTTTAMALPGIVNVNTTANVTRLSAYGYGTNQGYGLALQANNDSGAVPVYILNAAGSNIGSISATSSAVTFNTTSDYRLKENITPLTGALARVMATRVVSYVFKNDTNREAHDGFLAHELQADHPRAVTGKKDATWTHVTYRDGYDPTNVQPEDVLDIEHRMEPQLVDHSKLVPTLWAAVQELKAELNLARAEIAELKKRR